MPDKKLEINIFVPVLNQDLDFQRHISHGLFSVQWFDKMFEVKAKMDHRFVDIGWIVDHQCLNFLYIMYFTSYVCMGHRIYTGIYI